MGETKTSSAVSERAPVALRVLGDEALARLAAQGNRRAFEAIYERHHQALFRYVRAIVQHEEDATDVLQTTMVKAMRGLPSRKDGAPLKPWLFRIAHNEAIDLLRRRRPVESMDAAEDAAASVSDLERDAAVRERLRQLVTDLRELPERQRGALVMRELSGLDYEEIGTAFDISPSAAKQAVYEARVALHEKDSGRAMDCDDIRRTLSDGDKRMLRGRRVRAHLAACSSCSGFATALRARPGQLAAIAPPLAPLAAAGLLKGVLGSGAGGTSATGQGSAAAAVVAGTGKVLAGSLALKAALVAGTAAATMGAVTVAGGGFPIDLPGPLGDDEPAAVERRAADTADAKQAEAAAQQEADAEETRAESGGEEGAKDKPTGRRQGSAGRRGRLLPGGGGRRGRGRGPLPDDLGDTIRAIEVPSIPKVDPPAVKPPVELPPPPVELPPAPAIP